jgi:hypothetical protein
MRISGSRICSWERLIFRQENYSEAVTELAKARELSGGSSEAIGMTGYAWALAGDFPKAQAVLKELKARKPTLYSVYPSCPALLHTRRKRRGLRLAPEGLRRP